MQSPTPTAVQSAEESTQKTPTTTKAKVLTWWQWHFLITGSGTLLATMDNPNAVGDLLYLLPFNLILYAIPAWLIAKVVNAIRRK